jgi:hypothetical protein
MISCLSQELQQATVEVIGCWFIADTSPDMHFILDGEKQVGLGVLETVARFKLTTF